MNEDYIRIISNGTNELMKNVKINMSLIGWPAASSLIAGAICISTVIISGIKTYEKLEEYKRLWFMMGGVLYTARNERFHGDNFSHFKSSLSSIKTYGHFYYLLLFTYSLLWTVMLRLSLKSGYPDFVTANQVQTSIDRNIELYKMAFKE